MKKNHHHKGIKALTEYITNHTQKERSTIMASDKNETISLKKDELQAIVTAAVKAAKEDSEKEPSIINNFFYGAKAAVRGVADFASEKAEKAKKATKRERAIAEYMKTKNSEMEDFIKKFKDESSK